LYIATSFALERHPHTSKPIINPHRIWMPAYSSMFIKPPTVSTGLHHINLFLSSRYVITRGILIMGNNKIIDLINLCAPPYKINSIHFVHPHPATVRMTAIQKPKTRQLTIPLQTLPEVFTGSMMPSPVLPHPRRCSRGQRSQCHGSP
jgi:hypothetical protein